tara:strand:+ start:165 stop:398 length:234 start_codon:yes stop_codon:yes gene_type:complete
MSFTDECNYLSELLINYKEKIKDPFWEGWDDFWKELIIETERKLYLIKEQELCQKFQKLNSTNKTNSISTFLSISQS